MPPVEKRYSEDDVRDAIHKNFGIFTAVCNDLDCTFLQLRRYLVEHPTLSADMAEARNTIIDVAQTSLVECLNSKSDSIKLAAAQFTLKTLGRNLGYSDTPSVQLAV